VRDKRIGYALALVSAPLSHGYPIPAIRPEQVERFTRETLRAHPVRRFSARRAVEVLQASEGKKFLALDIGGDKISASYFRVRDGDIVHAGNEFSRHANGGTGYLQMLRDIGEDVQRESIPVGISFAGPTEGTRLIAGPNLPVFVKEFRDSYDSDFANLFPAVDLANDAEAGIMAGALEAVRNYPGAAHVIYVINGSGLGGAVLTADVLYAAEPGHIEAATQLNPFGQLKPCGLDGAAHVCLEAIGASKAGVEDIWFQRTGEQLPGQEIAARYLAGDRLALALYDNSVQVTAHAILGMASAFGLLSRPEQLAIVGHGGIFNVAGYGERLSAILRQELGQEPQVLLTKDFYANACLEGAAIAVAS
jgi:predicted NBD/HSP70 family sugar kinase